jgi:hypothetical protein
MVPQPHTSCHAIRRHRLSAKKSLWSHTTRAQSSVWSLPHPLRNSRYGSTHRCKEFWFFLPHPGSIFPSTGNRHFLSSCVGRHLSNPPRASPCARTSTSGGRWTYSVSIPASLTSMRRFRGSIWAKEAKYAEVQGKDLGNFQWLKTAKISYLP